MFDCFVNCLVCLFVGVVCSAFICIDTIAMTFVTLRRWTA